MKTPLARGCRSGLDADVLRLEISGGHLNAVRTIAILRPRRIAGPQDVVPQVVDTLRAIIDRHRGQKLATADERAGVEARGHRQRMLQLDVLLGPRSEEHTSELQSLMRISYAVFCLKKKKL